ncbi:MAG: SRPBCC domain-containing protein [Verrucomicrobiota bacterium]
MKVAPEFVWNALVQPEIVADYHFAPLLEIDLREGGAIRYGSEDAVLISGRILEFISGNSLSHTFQFGTESHSGTETDEETIVAYELEAESEGTLLRLTHSGFASENQTYANVIGGWPHILANMRQLLETERDRGSESEAASS